MNDNNLQAINYVYISYQQIKKWIFLFIFDHTQNLAFRKYIVFCFSSSTFYDLCFPLYLLCMLFFMNEIKPIAGEFIIFQHLMGVF